MRLTYTIGSTIALCVGAGILLRSCALPVPPPVANLGGWPPTSGACVRHDMVDIIPAGDELTRVHGDPACVAQISDCTWQNTQTLTFTTDAIGNPLWLQLASRQLSIADQDDIVSRARWNAHLSKPAGKYLYRLTFDSGIYTTTTANPSVGTVGATAYYGRCHYTGPIPVRETKLDDGPPPSK